MLLAEFGIDIPLSRHTVLSGRGLRGFEMDRTAGPSGAETGDEARGPSPANVVLFRAEHRDLRRNPRRMCSGHLAQLGE
jgi:hypothetical protein